MLVFINNSWAQHFTLYGGTHLCVVSAFAALVVLVLAQGRCDGTSDESPRRNRIDKAIGWIVLAIACCVEIFTLWPTRFDYRTSLPLHPCNLAVFIAFGALLLRWPLLRAITHFWGLGLCTFAFIFPDLSVGPAHFQFWTFWAGHWAIVGSAIYDMSARGYRPSWRDWILVVRFSAIYLATIFSIDIIFHLNYAYIGQPYSWQHSPVEAIGPWPWRVPIMFLAAMSIMLLMVLPWDIGLRRNANANCHR